MPTDDRRRAIGKVISVAADRFVIELSRITDNFTVVGFDDIHYVARLGSFLAVPVQTEYVIVEVVGLREKDSGGASGASGTELDKTDSAKFLDVVPIGMLPQGEKGDFRFGVSSFPSLYADALYMVAGELDRVFETASPSEVVPESEDNSLVPIAGSTRYKAITVGSSVVFEGYDVKVKVNEFFGGHAAILGNTGSGKSCTVASFLQSLFEKSDTYYARGATFIIFDVNGEYGAALRGVGVEQGIRLRTLLVDGTADPGMFRLPHWFLEIAEWELLLQASEKTQLPVLRAALGLTSLRAGTQESNRIRRHIAATCIVECLTGSNETAVAKGSRIIGLFNRYGGDGFDRGMLNRHGYNFQFGNFQGNGQQAFLDEVSNHIVEEIELPPYEGKPFAFGDLEEHLDTAILYEEAHGNRQIRGFCAQMLTRLKSLKSNLDYAFLKHSHDEIADAPERPAFLGRLLGLKKEDGVQHKTRQIVILDMNAVPDEVVELIASVVARMVFRALRVADPRNVLPVHLVLEEAHRYISNEPARHALDATRTFERIAKEGRKYGVFLLVASQRPSELSKTVLSQCSNFVVHRIQNPEDLNHIRQMTPFISDAVLRRLPSLPKQHALVFGNAVNIPTTFRVREAKPRPDSNDANIRRAWFHDGAGEVAIGADG